MRVHARVDLRMPLRRLRHAEQRVDLGIDALERAAVAQHREERARRRFAQRLLGLLPHAFGHQRVHLAPRHHAAHQRHRVGSDPKAERREARGEARRPQHAHRILDEGGGDVPQHPRFDVALAAERVDQRPAGRLRHRVDGQIAPREVLLERHLGSEFDGESAVAGCDLALEPRERVLLVRVRMQKYREVAPDLAVPEPQQLLPRAAHHHPIALLHRQPEQGVPNRPADQIHLHE